MEALIMAEKDFLEQLLDTITKRLDRVENKIDGNNAAMNSRVDKIEGKIDTNTQVTQGILTEAKYTNGRMSAAEKALRKLEIKRGKKIDLPPNVIYLIALGAVILLVVIASLLGVNLGGLVK